MQQEIGISQLAVAYENNEETFFFGNYVQFSESGLVS